MAEKLTRTQQRKLRKALVEMELEIQRNEELERSLPRRYFLEHAVDRGFTKAQAEFLWDEVKYREPRFR
jgi:hypothetical protein